MSTWWKSSLALSLGLVATAARGGDDAWRVPPQAGTAPPAATAPAVVLQKPIAQGASVAPLPPADSAHPDNAAAAASGPAVSLGRPIATLARPVPLGPDGAPAGSGILDPNLKLMSFSGVTLEQPVVRGVSADSNAPQKMPVGPTSDQSNKMFLWQPALTSTETPTAATGPEELHAPRAQVVTPLPTTPGLPGGVVVGDSGPPVFPQGDDCTCGSCAAPSVDGCACNGCGCYPGNRWYASAEYLLWWTKGDRLPPLLTTSTGADPNDPVRTGALGLPGTSVVYGNNTVADQARSGARFFVGYWLTEERLLGVEVGGFFLQSVQNSITTVSGGSPLLYRPFLGLSGTEQVELVATNVPAQLALSGASNIAGAFSSNHRTSLWGAEANLRSCLLCGDDYFIDGLAGVRMLALDDDLTVREAPNFMFPGMSITDLIEDRFQAGNRFYGGQVGAVAEWRTGRWSFDLKTKLALGVTQQTVKITGSSTLVDSLGNSIVREGGLLALSSNIGNYSRNAFSVVPEVGLSVGYQVTDHIRAFVGYDFLYWSNVVRAGQQIDRVVNTNFLPGSRSFGVGPPRPTFNFNSSDFWAQGIKVGVEFRY